MIKDADQDGRYALSSKEYFCIRQLFGFVSCLDVSKCILRDRARLIPGAWRDLNLLVKVCDKLISNLMKTVPIKKLRQIKTELSNTVITVEVKNNAGLPEPEKEAFDYVPESALRTLIENTLEWQCFTCQKTNKEAKNCPHRKAIDDSFPFAQPGDKKELCKYSGMHFDIETEEEE